VTTTPSGVEVDCTPTLAARIGAEGAAQGMLATASANASVAPVLRA
jgi:hypothetical protein